ncbi:MAG: FHA domain-containing protein [Hyphomicrobiaceae bacterium]
MSNKEQGSKGQGKFLGSLRDALKAASRDEDGRVVIAGENPTIKPVVEAKIEGASAMSSSQDGKPAASGNDSAEAPPPLPSAAEAAREARGGTPNIPPVDAAVGAGAAAASAPPTTRVVKEPSAAAAADAEPRTQLVRGRQPVQRGEFRQDPVVGWLVIVGGPGIGSYRPVFEGNNTIGRSTSNRIPIDFGDDAISGEEQAYIRYDSADRSFLLVPNMSKTNVVSVNEKRPTSAIALQTMDVITMGRTQLVFIPFCGPEFDWGELSTMKG